MLVLAFGGWNIYRSYQDRALRVSVKMVSVDGVERRFRIVEPKNLKPGCEVLFAFHGLGDSPDAMEKYTKLGRLAYSEQLLLVFPEAENGRWDVETSPGGDVSDRSDVKFFDAMLEQVRSDYDCDTTRLYAVGMSNGAAFVQLLAHARSDVLAAVAAHSGPCPPHLSQPPRPIPIFLLSGSEDLAVGAMETDVESYRAAGHETGLLIIDGLGHKWSIPHNANIWKFLSAHKLNDR